ncbi:MAG TPA: molybdopterin converting factor subunit 1 [Acidobacteriota bacterium]|nr:molybdopterin converting factor subunit 1 [Acidobacteriota bacterium]
MIRVLFFASLRDLAGTSNVELEPSGLQTAEDVFSRLLKRYPGLGAYKPNLLVAVNEEYAQWQEPVSDGDEIAFFPPVSGGCPQDTAGSAKGLSALTRDPIDRLSVMNSVAHTAAGAVATFDGVVRDHARGKTVTWLEYDCYESMARKQLERLRLQALDKWPLLAASVVHRVGHLQIGESSVFIAVSSSHRGEAFEACRWIIDTLKTSVPIWKKEHYQDGQTWIEESGG